MKALPVPTAMGSIHNGIMAGKLKGAMPATTPSGWRMVLVSILELICSTASPIMRDGIARQCSTTSIPLVMSPRASTFVLPFSDTMQLAISSLFSTSRVWNLIRTRVRCCTGTSRHFFCAATADATISSISSFVVHGTLQFTRTQIITCMFPYACVRANVRICCGTAAVVRTSAFEQTGSTRTCASQHQSCRACLQLCKSVKCVRASLSWISAKFVGVSLSTGLRAGNHMKSVRTKTNPCGQLLPAGISARVSFGQAQPTTRGQGERLKTLPAGADSAIHQRVLVLSRSKRKQTHLHRSSCVAGLTTSICSDAADGFSLPLIYSGSADISFTGAR